MRIELQADCFAGIILASIPSISFEPDYTFKIYFSFLKEINKFLSRNSFDLK